MTAPDCRAAGDRQGPVPPPRRQTAVPCFRPGALPDCPHSCEPPSTPPRRLTRRPSSLRYTRLRPMPRTWACQTNMVWACRRRCWHPSRCGLWPAAITDRPDGRTKPRLLTKIRPPFSIFRPRGCGPCTPCPNCPTPRSNFEPAVMYALCRPPSKPNPPSRLICRLLPCRPNAARLTSRPSRHFRSEVLRLNERTSFLVALVFALHEELDSGTSRSGPCEQSDFPQAGMGRQGPRAGDWIGGRGGGRGCCGGRDGHTQKGREFGSGLRQARSLTMPWWRQSICSAAARRCALVRRNRHPRRSVQGDDVAARVAHVLPMQFPLSLRGSILVRAPFPGPAGLLPGAWAVNNWNWFGNGTRAI